MRRKSQGTNPVRLGTVPTHSHDSDLECLSSHRQLVKPQKRKKQANPAELEQIAAHALDIHPKL